VSAAAAAKTPAVQGSVFPLSISHAGIVLCRFFSFFEMFRRDPFYTPAGMEQWLKGTIDNSGFKDIFNIH
jgi:hypothetical protein